DMDGVEWLMQLQNSYGYFGFKLGEWDDENGQVDYKHEEMKMGDDNHRRAMWHAIEHDAMGGNFFNGSAGKATSVISPIHAGFHNDDLDVPEYDPGKQTAFWMKPVMKI